MIYSLAFAINGLLSFLLLLTLAHALPIHAFGLFSLMLAAGLGIYALLYEWIRVCILRFVGTSARQIQIIRTNTIRYLYHRLAIGVAVGAVLVGIVAHATLGPLSVLVIAGLIISQGVFDYNAALARALSLRRAFARLLLMRGLSGFCIATVIALFTKDATLTLCGVMIGNLLPGALVAFDRLRDPALLAVNKTFARRCVTYGFPLIGSAAVIAFAPFLMRASLAKTMDLAAVGAFSLPFDTVLRIMMFLATAINVTSFQTLIDDYHHAKARQEFRAKTGMAAAGILMLLLPALAGFALVGKDFAGVFVPKTLRAEFINLYLWAILMAGFAVTKSFIFDVVLMVIHETMALLVGGCLALAVCIGGIAFAPVDAPLSFYAGILVAGQIAGFTVSAIWLTAKKQFPAWNAHLARVGLATLFMAAGVTFVPDMGIPMIDLALKTAIGVGLYAGFCWLLNPLDIRGQIKTLAKHFS